MVPNLKCAYYYKMQGEKLKYKQNEPIFYEDMNMEVQEEMYADIIKEQNKFTEALSALHQSYCPAQINARDDQMSGVRDFIIKGIASKGSSESLYVCGVPGIGKTLCIKKVAQKVCSQNKASMIYTNALTIKKPIEIFKSIHYEITRKKMEANEALYQLDNYFEKGMRLSGYDQHQGKCKVLIIDEIDNLRTRDFEVLYSIFEWTRQKRSKLIIISISNTLDFPETLTAKVASRMGRKSIVFKPYTSAQIQKIMNERVRNFQVFADHALTYICKKIAQCSSDIRKCLFILRQSIFEFLIQNKNKKIGKKQVSTQILSRTCENLYSDIFTQNFHQFPSAYKIVLYCLAKYYRNDTHPCTMRQLQSLLGTFVKSRTQLMPILTDLRDLGIIKVSYVYFKEGDVNSVTSLKFNNIKELKEQHIKLEVEYDRIFAALYKQNLKEIKFNINLDF